MSYGEQCKIFYPQKPLVDIAYILNESLKYNLYNDKLKKMLVSSLQGIFDGKSETIKLLVEINQNAADKEIFIQSKLSLAKCYFFSGKNDISRSLANELIISGMDRGVVLGAEMILKSIDQNK